ncbi:DIRC2-like protein [Mya arenaria]|uniref:DIRC2-like protein n=1 Tax=Mya arenaria TaxID=6604 RepID=A0ABY7EAA4_MYAAR|nr:DIRC2-like protein [Mya arenaria]
MSKSVLPGEGTPLLSAEGAAGDVTSVYMRRWYIVLVFSIGSFIQALGWNTWGPITESAEAVFGWHDSQIGMFANGGNIAFMICVLPFCYFMDVKGIRVSLLMCAVVVFIGTGIRCITMETTAMTWLANAGAVLLGIGGSVPFAGPAKLSSVWFPPDQRATATSIVSFANYFGVAMSFIFVCVNRDDLISEIRHLMYLHTAIAALFLLLVIVYFPDKPPTPPSKTASMERTEWLKGLRMLTKNSAFWLVVLAGAVSAGVLGVWASVLDVNLNKHGIPLFYEVSCEASYPVAEGVTGGVMTLVNNLFGVLFLCIMLIKDIGTSWMNWALFGSAVAALPLLILFPERYRRTDLDITIDIKPTSGDLQASDTTDDVTS